MVAILGVITFVFPNLFFSPFESCLFFSTGLPNTIELMLQFSLGYIAISINTLWESQFMALCIHGVSHIHISNGCYDNNFNKFYNPSRILHGEYVTFTSDI